MLPQTPHITECPHVTLNVRALCAQLHLPDASLTLCKMAHTRTGHGAECKAKACYIKHRDWFAPTARLIITPNRGKRTLCNWYSELEATAPPFNL